MARPVPTGCKGVKGVKWAGEAENAEGHARRSQTPHWPSAGTCKTQVPRPPSPSTDGLGRAAPAGAKCATRGPVGSSGGGGGPPAGPVVPSATPSSISLLFQAARPPRWDGRKIKTQCFGEGGPRLLLRRCLAPLGGRLAPQQLVGRCRVGVTGAWVRLGGTHLPGQPRQPGQPAAERSRHSLHPLAEQQAQCAYTGSALGTRRRRFGSQYGRRVGAMHWGDAL
jgi:hypothetical protein